MSLTIIRMSLARPDRLAKCNNKELLVEVVLEDRPSFMAKIPIVDLFNIGADIYAPMASITWLKVAYPELNETIDRLIKKDQIHVF